MESEEIPVHSDGQSTSGQLEHANRFKDGLIAASASGDLPEVQVILEEWQSMLAQGPLRVLPHDPTDPMWKAFAAAIENQRLEVIAYIMKNGFQVSATIAGVAARTKSVPVFQTLLDHGWDINQTGRGLPCLGLYLYDDPLCDWFLTHGADPNIANSAGYNALDLAAGSTHPGFQPLAVLQTLIQHGGQPARSSALTLAAKAQRPSSETIEIMAYLLDHGALINARQMEWRPERHDNCTSKMMDGTALHVAVRRMDEEMVEFLLRRGADPRVENWEGCNALGVKAWRGDPRWEGIRGRLLEAVEALGGG